MRCAPVRSGRLRPDLTRETWTAGTADAADWLCLPDIDERALRGLKSTSPLPPATLANLVRFATANRLECRLGVVALT
ncbi:hypothetical protein E1200_01205 [Actinomadura sp. GC306]|nr:hypothetical protein E1200_01205 [Actinomadura sp. GC306]